MVRFSLLNLVLAAGLLAGCQTNDLKEPPVPLGDFVLGLNVAVADNAQKSPISRDATAEAWEAAVEKALDDRFGRYEGKKIYNIGVSVDGYALAPPGLPVVLKPKSILIATVNVWDDAAQKKLNSEGKQLTIFEKMSGETVVGSGLTQTKEQQMATLAYNAAKAIEGWFLQNPEWFGMTAEDVAAAKEAAVAKAAGKKAAVSKEDDTKTDDAN